MGLGDQLTSLFGKAGEDARGTLSRPENGSYLPVWENRTRTIDNRYIP